MADDKLINYISSLCTTKYPKNKSKKNILFKMIRENRQKLLIAEKV